MKTIKAPKYSAEKRFCKRYCDPETGELRVELTFVRLDSEEWTSWYSRRVFEAYKGLLKGLLGRDATDDEIFGRVSIEPGILKNLEKKKKNVIAEVSR
ncbi:MAG: hypothetical protein JW734_06490 [Candidatus Omnitrophica bacterium]|nr:hypothetical protein [Candidatus Omnitrophota bacterium]